MGFEAAKISGVQGKSGNSRLMGIVMKGVNRRS
jgi:hypothetical protein